MKRILYIFSILLAVATGYGQTITIYQGLGQAWGGGSAVDVNNDGHLDFYMTGNKNNPKEPLLDEEGTPLDLNDDGIADTTERWQRMYFWNTEIDLFDQVNTSLRVTERSNLDWADVDNDGLLDLLATEHSFDFYHGGVYKNNGDGTFEKLDFPIPERACAGAWADFNNDGNLDYVILSQAAGNSGVYINNGDNTFEATNVDVFGEYQFGLGYCEVIDYNNDGFMDVFVTSNCDNPAANDNARVICDVFINYNEEPGNFYRAFLGKSTTNPSGSIYQKGNGGVDFADYNSDGWLDMVLHGEGGAGTLEPSSGDIWACISHVYLNQKDGTFTDKAQSAFQADLRPLCSSGVGTATIDWNNDGNYDLFISGWNPPTVNTQDAYLYYGDGAGNFTDQGRVPGASETIILLNDWNDDGFPDYMASGHSWDEMFYPNEADRGRTASVMINPNTSTPNAVPAVPANLNAAVDEANVTLSWDEATDDNTPAKSLSYEYFLKDGDGNFLIAPASFVGGDNDGIRKVVKLGNCFLNTFSVLKNLPADTYTWGVQAIDAQYKGSAFATGTFTIEVSGIKENTNSLVKIYSFGNNLYIRSASGVQTDVVVYDLVGKSVLQESFTGNFRKELSAGAYIVKVQDGSSIRTEKVIIQ